MDFETRGEIAGAIDCYEKAINGGLNMPAAHFALGLLYIQDQRASAAQQSLTKSAENQDYAEASRVALSRIQ
jgi:hypothetical protein